jgi:RIO kinase 1
LPAVNQPKKVSSHAKDKIGDQMAAFSKYNSRLAKINTPYTMGVGVNRKGPSAHANLKDKADRATTELVLDNRTRLILFKMIGRGLIHEVNGCISTGKEVQMTPLSQSVTISHEGRLASTTPPPRRAVIWH